MQAVETCRSRELTLIKLMIRKLPEQTVDGGHPPGAFVAASGRESASDWVVSLGKRRFSSRPTFRPCLSGLQSYSGMPLHSYIVHLYNMHATCITKISKLLQYKISKILYDGEIKASPVLSLYLPQLSAESLPLFWELHPSWSPILRHSLERLSLWVSKCW